MEQNKGQGYSSRAGKHSAIEVLADGGRIESATLPSLPKSLASRLIGNVVIKSSYYYFSSDGAILKLIGNQDSFENTVILTSNLKTNSDQVCTKHWIGQTQTGFKQIKATIFHMWKF